MNVDIDHTQHPAFAALVPKRASESTGYEVFFREVDGLADDIFAGHGDANGFEARWGKFESAVKPLRKSVEALIDADSVVNKVMVPMVKKSLKRSIDRLAIEKEQRRQRMRPDFMVSTEARKISEFIDNQGFMEWHMPKRWLAPLQEFVRADIEKMRAKFAEGTGNLLLTEAGDLPHAIVRDFCHQGGIFEALSALYGRTFDKVGFSIHVSHPGDRWFHVFDDVGLPVSATADYHYDEAYEVPKAMIYMNDVGEDQGPFSLVPESQKWANLGSWLNYKKELQIMLAQYRREEVNGAAVGNNVSIFRTPEVREVFASLPAGLRGVIKPGDQILNDTEMSREVLAKEKRIVGEAGTFGLFTGSHVMHRGGIAKQGERWALQVCFWPKDKVKLPKKEAKAAETAAPKKSLFSFFSKAAVAAVAEKPAAVITTASAVYSEPALRLQLKAILGDAPRLQAVDVGGANNLQPHWHKLHQAADYIVYEPHSKSYDELVAAQQGNNYFKNFRYLKEALAGTAGTRTLYKANVPTCSSLLKPRSDSLLALSAKSSFFPVTEEPLQTTTLAASLGSIGVETAHCIKLDTQGTELEILQGLGKERLDKLLLVEMEIAVQDYYEGGSTRLEEVIPFLRDHGLVLFDARTNRSAGNASLLAAGTVEALLGTPPRAASVALRLNEFDGIFIRDPRLLIDVGTDAATVRQLIVLLCAYNLYGEALFTISYGHDKGVFGAGCRDSMLAAVKAAHAQTALQVVDVEQWMAGQKRQNWGQYMWVPFPSA